MNDLLSAIARKVQIRVRKVRPNQLPLSVWEERQQDAFDSPIEKLTSPPILAYADYRQLHRTKCYSVSESR